MQAGVDSAQAGDTVRVAAGLYTWTAQGGANPSSGWSMIVLKTGITLASESGPLSTILDAEGQGRVILCQNASDVVIEGFWIRNGNAFDDQPISVTRGSGGGILLGGVSGIVRNNLITHNTAYYIGGGIETDHPSPGAPPLITGNIIYANQAGIRGSALEGHGSSLPVIRGNTILDNIGSAIGLVNDGGTIENNIIAGTQNNGSSAGVAFYCVTSTPLVQCNNVWNNAAGDTLCGIDGGGNFSEDPQFCALDPGGGLNFTLQADSPCSPGNHPQASACDLIGAAGVGCAGVAVERRTWGAVKNFYGKRR